MSSRPSSFCVSLSLSPNSQVELTISSLLPPSFSLLPTSIVISVFRGSTLSLAYAQTHPSRVKALILRGIFCLRRSELEFFYQNGASHLFPEAWDDFVAPIPEEERGDMMQAYHKRLNSEDEAIRLEAAK